MLCLRPNLTGSCDFTGSGTFQKPADLFPHPHCSTLSRKNSFQGQSSEVYHLKTNKRPSLLLTRAVASRIMHLTTAYFYPCHHWHLTKCKTLQATVISHIILYLFVLPLSCHPFLLPLLASLRTSPTRLSGPYIPLLIKLSHMLTFSMQCPLQIFLFTDI